MNHFKYIYILSRPLNVLIAILSVFIAAIISPLFEFNTQLIFALIVTGLVTAGANIVNDIFDIEIDKVNKPSRPLASGAVKQKTAWIYFYTAYFVAFVFSVFTGWLMFLISLVISILLYFYSAKYKRTVLWGNLFVSLSTGIAFIYGSLAVNDYVSGLFPALFAFMFHFGREIVKDMQDLKGDLQYKAVTFAGRFGRSMSVLLINIIFTLLIFLTLLPYILEVYSFNYLITVLIGVDSVLAGVSVFLWFNNSPSALGKISHLLKLDMFVGLLSIYIGSHHVIFIN